MGDLRQYSIPFRGLKDGRHEFVFTVDHTFFEHFDSSEVQKGLVNVHVELVKHTQFLELVFSLQGKVTVYCDRCLEPFVLGIEHEADLYVRFGDQTIEQSEEVLILAEAENELKLAQYLYEYIHLAIPYQRVHPDLDGISGCDPDMISRLEEHRVEESESQTMDPRWDVLKQINNNE